MVQVSPPDEHGFCSFGVSVDYTKPAAQAARTVIAQVNPKMPRTMGDTFIHVSEIDHLVETDAGPSSSCRRRGSARSRRRSARNFAELVEDGDTLQLGIGAIPDAVLKELDEKNDLGIHSEMFSDGVVDLIEGVGQQPPQDAATGTMRRHLPHGHASAVRLRRRQPDRQDGAGRLRQRPARDRPERQRRLDQLLPCRST